MPHRSLHAASTNPPALNGGAVTVDLVLRVKKVEDSGEFEHHYDEDRKGVEERHRLGDSQMGRGGRSDVQNEATQMLFTLTATVHKSLEDLLTKASPGDGIMSLGQHNWSGGDEGTRSVFML